MDFSSSFIPPVPPPAIDPRSPCDLVGSRARCFLRNDVEVSCFSGTREWGLAGAATEGEDEM